MHGRNPIRTRRRGISIAAVAALATALVLPAVAGAHVTLQPDTAPAGEFVRLDVRVPNERDNAGTTKVEVQLPPGFAFASWEPVPGWEVAVKHRKAAEPIESHGETITEEIATITWTGDGREGIVPPGAFQDFGLSVQMPDSPGEELEFKSLQTYENGGVVRWIGPPDSEEPAPLVAVNDAPDEEGEGDDSEAEADSGDDDDGSSNGLAIAALALGAIGLATGGAALRRSRNR